MLSYSCMLNFHPPSEGSQPEPAVCCIPPINGFKSQSSHLEQHLARSCEIMQSTELQHNIPHAKKLRNPSDHLILLMLTFPHTALHTFLRWQFPMSITTSTSKRHRLSVSKSIVSYEPSSKQQKSPCSFPHFAVILFCINRKFFLSIDFLRVSLRFL